MAQTRINVDSGISFVASGWTEKHLNMRINMARFPFHKTLESFDFKF